MPRWRRIYSFISFYFSSSDGSLTLLSLAITRNPGVPATPRCTQRPKRSRSSKYHKANGRFRVPSVVQVSLTFFPVNVVIVVVAPFHSSARAPCSFAPTAKVVGGSGSISSSEVQTLNPRIRSARERAREVERDGEKRCTAKQRSDDHTGEK
ncbi:hypothetical protein ZHAS_00015629 [Anopheles sinensis]|uniref:Uncharacterized protein n=1 Tax=Anopheles sinensis TaxID=74873 RepID=A0A084WAY9_ANOSI|nr:hypothetical protein ZHAS_00015629 [Anopheles sinensis]